MNVAELIELLKQQPQDMQVACRKYSEYCLLESDEMYVIELGEARPDGWVHDKRPDKATQKYLLIDV